MEDCNHADSQENITVLEFVGNKIVIQEDERRYVKMSCQRPSNGARDCKWTKDIKTWNGFWNT